MRWVEHVGCITEKNSACRVLGKRSEGENPVEGVNWMYVVRM
jgi:hypothetical protein